MKLDPFYPIVDSVAWIDRLLPLGVKLVQLRIKEQQGVDLRDAITRSRDACRKHGCQLIVNDHWQLAIEERCDFIHLGQEDLADADITAIRKAEIRVGVSTHDGDELDTALSIDPDYIALGPVFETSSKEVGFAPQGLEKIRDWKQDVGNRPLVAIGGITLELSASVFRKGADSIAVISDVTRNMDPEARTEEWLVATEAWR